MKVSRACKPPFSITAADLSNMDLGTVCPDRSSMAAGKFSDARTLMTKGNKQTKKISWRQPYWYRQRNERTAQLLIYFGSLESVMKIVKDLKRSAKKKKTNYCLKNINNSKKIPLEGWQHLFEIMLHKHPVIFWKCLGRGTFSRRGLYRC